MSFRGIFFLGIFAVCCAAAFFEPFAGVIAYVIHYHVSPENTYWGKGLSAAGVRYSVTISACLFAGTLLNAKRLPYGRLLSRQEVLCLVMLAWVVVLGVLLPQKTAFFHGRPVMKTNNVDKLVKLLAFALILTHVVVVPRRFKQFIWVLVACGFYVGYEAYTMPRSMYSQSRIEGIGGPDFHEANSLAAHMTALLPWIGVHFLRVNWKGKPACFVAGGFTANTVILTQSRASMLAIAAGILASFALVPKGDRKRIWPLLVLGICGGLSLVDSQLEKRMDTLQEGRREKDGAIQERLKIWKASVPILMAHPLGVGPNNFPAYIGKYVPECEGRDSHNTYVRCTTELGVVGLAILAALIGNAFWTLFQIRRRIADDPRLKDWTWYTVAGQLSLLMYLICGAFATFLYSEMLWWLLLLPSAMERTVNNAQLELSSNPAGAPPR